MHANIVAAAAVLAAVHLTAGANVRPPHADTHAVLTRSQAAAAGMSDIVANFDRIDANKDGVITRDELRSYLLVNRRYAPMT